VFTPEQAKLWGTDRMFFLLNLRLWTEVTMDEILKSIDDDIEMYGGGIGYIDLEDYNVVDLFQKCKEKYGEGIVLIAPTASKHQIEIFSELQLAAHNGYLKAPPLDIWLDDRDVIHYEKPPIDTKDMLRAEMSVFECRPKTDKSIEFGSPFKRRKRPKPGEPRDDIVYAIAHACKAAIRGDMPAIATRARGEGNPFASMLSNPDLLGDYGAILA
jgi:hypothetical protein